MFCRSGLPALDRTRAPRSSTAHRLVHGLRASAGERAGGRIAVDGRVQLHRLREGAQEGGSAVSASKPVRSWLHRRARRGACGCGEAGGRGERGWGRQGAEGGRRAGWLLGRLPAPGYARSTADLGERVAKCSLRRLAGAEGRGALAGARGEAPSFQNGGKAYLGSRRRRTRRRRAAVGEIAQGRTFLGASGAAAAAAAHRLRGRGSELSCRLNLLPGLLPAPRKAPLRPRRARAAASLARQRRGATPGGRRSAAKEKATKPGGVAPSQPPPPQQRRPAAPLGCVSPGPPRRSPPPLAACSPSGAPLGAARHAPNHLERSRPGRTCRPRRPLGSGDKRWAGAAQDIAGGTTWWFRRAQYDAMSASVQVTCHVTRSSHPPQACLTPSAGSA